jgi:hypothetical protein
MRLHLGPSPELGACRTPEPLALLFLSGKAMADKAPDLLQLFSDVLLTARLDDQERFKQVRPGFTPWEHFMFSRKGRCTPVAAPLPWCLRCSSDCLWSAVMRHALQKRSMCRHMHAGVGAISCL